MLAQTTHLLNRRPACCPIAPDQAVLPIAPRAQHTVCRSAIQSAKAELIGPGAKSYTLGGSAQLVQECSVHNWKSPLKCDAGADEGVEDIVVALGKFDAMHIGHRSLAVKASADGCQPVLLSFSGIAQVLGLPVRLPLVAAADRPRVLASWAQDCSGRPPRQRMVPFHEIRTMSPEQFVAVLAQELGAAGVVAGRNYRFGFKAAGDAAALQELGTRYGMRVHIVDLVSSATPSSQPEGLQQGSDHEDVQEVSSSKIRELLACRDVQSVQRLLGRQYRLVVGLPPPSTLHPFPQQPHNNPEIEGHNEAFVPSQCFLNMPPAPGRYQVTVTLALRQKAGGPKAGGDSSGLMPGSSSCPSNGNGSQSLSNGQQQGPGDPGLQAGAVVQCQACVCELSTQGLQLRGAGQDLREMLEQLLHGAQAKPAYLVIDFLQ